MMNMRKNNITVELPIVSLFRISGEADAVMFSCPTGRCIALVGDGPCPYLDDNRCGNLEVQRAAMEVFRNTYTMK